VQAQFSELGITMEVKMNGLKLRSGLVIAAVVCASAALGWARLAEQKLYINGKVASAGVIVSNGIAYVPVKDVALALEMTAEKRPDGYALVRAGGANQVQGLTGKIGDDLFNGMYRVKVIRVIRKDRYERQFAKGDPVSAPDGKEVVAVVMRLKNGTKEARLIDLVYPGSNTGLTDGDEHSYGPITGLASDTPERAANLLPGAAVDTALVFFVPKGVVLMALVFEVGVAVHGPAFRVSLKDTGASN